MLFVHWCLWP